MVTRMIACAFMLGLSACAQMPLTQADAHGPITPAQLQHDYPLFSATSVDSADILQLRTALAEHPDIEFKVFFGTWCHDSQRVLPKLLGLLANVPAEQFSLALHAQPRAKAERTQIYRDFNVGPLPSILVLRNGQEIGRVIELPKTTLAADLAELIGKS